MHANTCWAVKCLLMLHQVQGTVVVPNFTPKFSNIEFKFYFLWHKILKY